MSREHCLSASDESHEGALLAVQRAGELAPRLQIVLSGALAAVEGDSFLGSLGEGDCFGVGSLLHGTPAAATVLCSSESRRSPRRPLARSLTLKSAADASVGVLLRESYLEEFAAFVRTREPPSFVLPQLPLDEPVSLADADEVEIEEWQPELAAAFERRFGADTVASALRAAPIVQRMGLHDKVIEEWAREAERRVLEPSQLVFAQSDAVDEESHVFLVISGSLSEHRAEHAPDPAVELAGSSHSRLEDLYGPCGRLLLPGDLFGEAELRLEVEARGRPGKVRCIRAASHPRLSDVLRTGRKRRHSVSRASSRENTPCSWRFLREASWKCCKASRTRASRRGLRRVSVREVLSSWLQRSCSPSPGSAGNPQAAAQCAIAVCGGGACALSAASGFLRCGHR